MTHKVFDVIIIGAGPIGLACGIEAARKGMNYIIVEKGPLVNSIFNYPLGMTFFSTSERLEIGGVPFICNNVKPVRSEALEYYRRVGKQWELQVKLYEETLSIDKQDDVFTVLTTKECYQAFAVVLATGFYDIAQKINVEGENLPKVHHYYKEAHPYAGCKVIVIGAANSAVDAALECYRKGAEVTMVVRQAAISDRVKYWVKPDIENRIKENSIMAYFESQVVKITPTQVEIGTPNGNVVLNNDFVLAMTGYLPNFKLLTDTGIELSNNGLLLPTYNANTMETNIRNLYLAGVVCGGKNTHQWFIENSRVHAILIMNDLKEKLTLFR